MRDGIWAIMLSGLCLQPLAAAELRVIPLGAADDPRLPALVEAIDFWNRQLENAGFDERLVPGELQDNPVATEFFITAQTRRGALPSLPELDAVKGDILVAFVDAHFISFTMTLPDQRRLIGMRSIQHPLLDHPGVAANILAHEIGHALGLKHDSDPASLMCGAPANCRPDRFAEGQGEIFPLLPGALESPIGLH